MSNRNSSNISLKDLITESKVRALAGGDYFARGVVYFQSKRVLKINEKDDCISAEVKGSSGSYLISISIKDTKLEYSCSCPLGMKGKFCKHLVAGCLKFIEDTGTPVELIPQRVKIGDKDVRAFLEKMEKVQIIDLIFEFAQDNGSLKEQLKLLVASRSKNKGAATFKKSLGNAFYIDDFIHYNEVYDYCHGIELVVDALKQALKQGHFNVVLEATEHGLAYAEEVINAVDSECELHDIFHELLKLHIEAYKKSDFDPRQMAKRLFLWEINDGYGIFDISSLYIDQLDEECRREFFCLVKSEWEKLPSLKPGEKGSCGDSRYRLTNIMENAARKSNSLQELIAVKRKDMSCAFSYLEIAEECRKAKEFELALQWAEDGVKTFPNDCDSRLLDFLADEYHRLKRHDDAMKTAWRIFVQSLQLQGYQKLAEHAGKARCWDVWRSKAIDSIRQQMESDKKRNKHCGFQPNSSRLVEILIWEKRNDEAWIEAVKGGCRDQLWMTLASLRAESHPADTVAIYRKRIPDIIGQTNNNAYAEAVDLLKKIRECIRRLKQEPEFKNYCDTLRQEYKGKRNFIAEMNRAKL